METLLVGECYGQMKCNTVYNYISTELLTGCEGKQLYEVKKIVTNLYLSPSLIFTFTLILDVIVLLLRVVSSGVSNS